MHVGGHAGGHHPRRDCARIEQRTVNDRAGRVYSVTDGAPVRVVAAAQRARIPFDGSAPKYSSGRRYESVS